MKTIAGFAQIVRIRTSTPLMLLTLFPILVFPQVRPEGLRLIEREQVQQGLLNLRSIAVEQPSAISWYNLGYGLLEAEDTRAAIEAFDHGIASDVRSGLNYAGKGRAVLMEGDLPGATALLQKALDLSRSKDAAVLNAVARAWLTRQDHASKAIALLMKSESIAASFETSILMGDAFLQQGNGGMAIIHYEHAASYDLKDPLPHFRIGQVYLRSTNKEAALEAFSHAVAIDPGYTRAWKEIAELQYSFRNGAEAVRAQEKYLGFTEFKDRGLSNLGFYYFMARDFPRSAEAFEGAWTRGLLTQTGLKYFAIALDETGSYEKAGKLFGEYFKNTKPEQVVAADYVAYGKLLLKLERDSLAVLAFDDALALGGTQVAVKQLKAETLFKVRRYGEAASAYDDLIRSRQKPTSQDLYSLGRALYFNGDFREADSTFRKLIESQPAITLGYLWAARSNASLDPESTEGLAKPFYEKLVELAQKQPELSKNELKEAYSYLGYFYLLKNAMDLSRQNWEKVLAIDPGDERAKEAIRIVKR